MPLPWAKAHPTCCGLFPTWLLTSQGLSHFGRIVSVKFLLFLFPFPYLLSEDITGLEGECLGQQGKRLCAKFHF